MHVKPTRLYPHVFPPAQRCIYCDATDALSLEHIIPKSLSGALLLPQASCGQCADLTKRFEQTCARTIFGPLRVTYGMPTRRKSERPREFVVEAIDASGNKTNVVIPAANYPRLIFLLQFCHLPNVLQAGLRQMGEPLKAFVQLTEATDLGNHVGHALGHFDAFAFARLIAKIGHGLASATLAPTDFRPIALDFILGKSDDLHAIVGGMDDIAPSEDVLHWVRLRDHFCVPSKRRFVVGYVRLFACFGTPTYVAAVGERAWDAPLLDAA